MKKEKLCFMSLAQISQDVIKRGKCNLSWLIAQDRSPHWKLFRETVIIDLMNFLINFNEKPIK